MKTLVIAEVAQAHDGSVGMAHAYIDALAQTGVDAVKFQVHIAEAESSEHEPFRVPFSFADKTRFDYWRRVEFTRDEWQTLKTHCDQRHVEFLASPFSIAAVELLESIGLRRYKIGSAEVADLLLLDRVTRTGKEMWLSSGMSSLEELDSAVQYVRAAGNRFAVLQCTTAYPTPPERIGLPMISELKQRYGVPVGLSDHSGTIYPGVAAVALGAELVEVHAVFDTRSFGPDSKASLTIDDVARLVEGVRVVERAMAPVEKGAGTDVDSLKKTFGRSLAVRRALSGGHTLAPEDLETKKPAGHGVPSREFRSVVGRRLKRDMRRYEFLTEQDLA